MAESAEKSINSLRAAVKAAQNELAQYSKGTDEHQSAVKRLVAADKELRDVQKDIQAVTQTTSEMFSNASASIAGFAGGVQAGIGVMELFGIESDKIGDSLAKLQAIQGVVQGFTSLSAGIKSATTLVKGLKGPFDALNKVMKANPVLAIVTGVTLLTVGIAGLVKVIGNNTKKQNDLNKAQNEYNNYLETSAIAHDKELRLAKARGASGQDLINITRKQIAEDIAETQALIDKYEGYKKLNKEQKENLRLAKESLANLQARNNALDVDEEVLNAQNEADEQADAAKKKKELEEKQAAEAKKRREKELQDLKRFNEAKVKLWETYEQQMFESGDAEYQLNAVGRQLDELEILAKRYQAISNDSSKSDEERAIATEKLTESLQKRYELENQQKALTKEIAEAEKADQEARLERNKTEKGLNDQLAKQQEEYEEIRLKRDLTEREIAERELMQAEERQLKYDKEIKDIEAKLEKDIENQAIRIQLMQDLEDARQKAFNNEQNIYSSREKLRKQDEDNEKKSNQEKKKALESFLSDATSLVGENTVAGKALAVAGAVIDTYKAGTLALSSAPPPFNYVLLASTLATGFATVKNILKTDVPGTSDSSSASVESAIPSMPELQSPIQETHNNMDAYDEQFFNASTKVKLTEYDLEQFDSRVELVEDETSYS